MNSSLHHGEFSERAASRISYASVREALIENGDIILHNEKHNNQYH